jgi:hypothetical protein
LKDETVDIVHNALRSAVFNIFSGTSKLAEERQELVINACLDFSAAIGDEEAVKEVEAQLHQRFENSKEQPVVPTVPAAPEAPVNLFFPRLVAWVMKDNKRLYLKDCKVHLALSGMLYLVPLEYGSSMFGMFNLKTGKFTPTKACKPEYIQQLQEIEEGGADAIKKISALTGQCCRCGRTLTNEHSIEEGIGPICAGKIGEF